MKNKFFLFAFFSFCLLSATTMHAQQKYAHLNLGNLMEQLPEIAEANDALVAYNDSLAVQDSTMAAKFRLKYEKYMQEANEGLLTRLQMENMEKELRKEQSEIVKFEENANVLVQIRRDSLLTPILTRIDTAIQTVAKENGYAMIFDTSKGAMLFAQESDDVTELVREKLKN